LADGDYNTASNWAGNQVAMGAGNTANFSTLDINDDVSVTLNTPLTIGNMLFGDTNTATGGSWELRTDNPAAAIITLDNSGAKPNITVNPLVPATTFDDAFIGHNLAGTMGFNKLGNGILTLGPGTTNTITGGINVNAGRLRVQGTLPVQPITLANGTAMDSAATVNGVTVAAGGTATYTLTGGNNSASNVTSPGPGTTLNLNIATNNVTLSAGGSWTGFSTINVTGQNATGVSFLRVMPNPTGGPPAFDLASFANTHLHLDNAQLLIRTNSFGNTMPIGELTGTATGVLSGGNAGSAARYELGGMNTNSEFAGIINGAGGLSVNKVGTGTLTLSGTFMNSPALGNQGQAFGRQGGVFRVTAGTMRITGATSIPGGPDTAPSVLTTIDVLPGATFDVSGAPGTFATSTQQKIQGGGTVVGNYNHPAGQIRPGDVGAPTPANEGNLSAAVTPTAGTLTFNGNLQLNGGTIVYDMAATPGPGNDLVQVNGSTTLTSGRVVPNFLAGVPAGGTYTVLTSTGGFSGSAANIVVDWPGRTPNSPMQASGNSLVFSPSAIVPGKSLTWTGTNGNNWDVETTQNWTDGTMPERFFDLDTVAFTEAATNKNVTVAAVVQPEGTITINNTTPYAFTGTGSIVGTVGLTKTGSGQLTMQVNNTFSGPASITGSTVDIGGMATGLGTGALTLNNATLISTVSIGNASLDIPAGTTTTIQLDGAAAAAGASNIPNLTGDGTLNLTSTIADKFFGTFNTTGFTGTLNVMPSGAAGQLGQVRIRGGQTDFSNAVVNLMAASVSNQQGAAANSLVTVGFGELHADATSNLVAFNGGSVPPDINWEIGALNTNSDVAGVIADGAGSGGDASISNVTKVGTGTLVLTGVNTYTGNTSVEAGTLRITNSYLADAADVFIDAGATLNLDFSGDDVIDSLYLDGMPQAPGFYGIGAMGAAFFAGTGRLQVSTLGPELGIDGDFNNNGVVDAADYVLWRNGGPLENDPTPGVQPEDFDLWRANFGLTGGAGAAASIGNQAAPEPAAWLMAMLAAIAAGSSRRRR
jgi:autotransporter-associated beta strand protein